LFSGWAWRRRGRPARQLVRHGGIIVDGQKVDIPSYLVRVGQEISVEPNSREKASVKRALDNMDKRGRLTWLEFSREKMGGRLLAIPSREDIPTEVDEQLIVELYSK
jgi:small subunit ribosomal protein S4